MLTRQFFKDSQELLARVCCVCHIFTLRTGQSTLEAWCRCDSDLKLGADRGFQPYGFPGPWRGQCCAGARAKQGLRVCLILQGRALSREAGSIPGRPRGVSQRGRVSELEWDLQKGSVCLWDSNHTCCGALLNGLAIDEKLNKAPARVLTTSQWSQNA